MACLGNSVNGLLCFRALGKFSECQDHISMFKSGRTFQMVGRTYQVKRKQKERKKKGGKNEGKKIGRKERKKEGKEER